MDVVERPNAHGQQRVRLIDEQLPTHTYWPHFPDGPCPMGREITTLTVDQAERLAPKLMEWAIKRARAKNGSR